MPGSNPTYLESCFLIFFRFKTQSFISSFKSVSGSQSRRFPETSKVWIFSRFPIELGSSVSWFSLRKSMRNFEHFPILGVNSSSLLRPTWRTVKWDKFPTDSGKTERQFSVKTSSESSRQLPILSDKWRILFWSILSKIIHFSCF